MDDEQMFEPGTKVLVRNCLKRIEKMREKKDLRTVGITSDMVDMEGEVCTIEGYQLLGGVRIYRLEEVPYRAFGSWLLSNVPDGVSIPDELLF